MIGLDITCSKGFVQRCSSISRSAGLATNMLKLSPHLVVTVSYSEGVWLSLLRGFGTSVDSIDQLLTTPLT